MSPPRLFAVLLASVAHLSVPAFAQTDANKGTDGEIAKEGEGALDKNDSAVAAATASTPSAEPGRRPAPSGPEEIPVYPPETAPSEPSWPLQKMLGVTLIAVGGASIATGIAMGVVAGFKYADLANRGCTERACQDSIVSSGDLDSARTFVSVSAGTLIGGVAVWTGGIILLATAPQSSAFGARVMPVLGLRHIGVNITF
jgi:hypothetical protein